MNILLYHPVLMPVLRYGGTERVALWLIKTLQKKGHSVTVFAAPGSKMPAGIGCITDPEVLRKRAKEFNVIHGFSRLPSEIEAEVAGRVLFTVHGNGKPGEVFHENSVYVSRNHAERHAAQAFVYNGLDPDELQFEGGARPNRFLFLSKTTWKVKNLRGAYRLSNEARQSLWVAGGNGPFDLRARVNLRHLLGGDSKWVGSVDQEQKAQFLKQGRALLFPILWNEPFGLVMVEALMTGTPVLANALGSVPEVLEFAPECLMHTRSEWLSALKGEVNLPSPKRCRDWAISRFHQDQMADRYVELYEKVSRGEKINLGVPQTQVAATEVPSSFLSI